MTPGFDGFARQARLGGGIVPVTREVVLDGDTPVTAFTKLHRGSWGFLLESLEGGERWARYTFLATEPREVFRYRGRQCARWSPGESWQDIEADTAPLEHLGRTMRRYAAGRGARPAPVHRRCGGLLGLRRRADDRVTARPTARRPRAARCDRDGGRHAAGARQPLQPRHGDRERGGAGGRGRRRAPPALRRRRGADRALARAARRPRHDAAPGDRGGSSAPHDRLAVPRRAIPGRRAPHQGVHRGGRHLPDGAEPPHRPRRPGSIPQLSLSPGAQPGAVSLLPALRRHPRHRQLARDPGAGGGRRGDGAPDRRHPAARRRPRARMRRWRRSWRPIPRSAPSI